MSEERKLTEEEVREEYRQQRKDKTFAHVGLLIMIVFMSGVQVT